MLFSYQICHTLQYNKRPHKNNVKIRLRWGHILTKEGSSETLFSLKSSLNKQNVTKDEGSVAEDWKHPEFFTTVVWSLLYKRILQWSDPSWYSHPLSKCMKSYCTRLVAEMDTYWGIFYASVVFFFDIQRQHSKLRACVPFWISLPFRNIHWSSCSASEALKWQQQYLIWSLCCQLLFFYSPTWSYLVLLKHRFPGTFTQFHLDITKTAFDTNLVHFDEVSIDSTNMIWHLDFFFIDFPLCLSSFWHGIIPTYHLTFT